jgi:hypothetical protein
MTTPPSVPSPSTTDPARFYWDAQLAALFQFDELHVRQKLFSVSSTYYLTDVAENLLFLAVRPAKLAINIVLGVVASLLRIVVLIYCINLIAYQGRVLEGILIIALSNLLIGIPLILLSPYRHIEVFRDESKSWRVLTITQDNKLGFYRNYTLYNSFGEPVALMSRNVFAIMFRRDWWVTYPDGSFLARVREDSLIRSLLRRYLGPMYGLLLTNFNLENERGTILGVFDRKLTLTDQYVLKMSGDPHRTLDRRVCLTMAILLDTAESR